MSKSDKVKYCTKSVAAIDRLLSRPCILNTLMSLLLLGAIAIAFWKVLPSHIIFLAPDAPLEALSFHDAVAQLFVPAPTLSNLFRLFPFPFSYELSFWADMVLLCFATYFLLHGMMLSREAAWVGGFAATFTGYFATLFCAGHRGVVDAIAITCLAFGLIHRAIMRKQLRWFVLLGALLPFGLAAQADIWFIILVGVMTYACFLIVLRCRTEGLRPVLRTSLLGVLCAGICFGIVGIPALKHTFGAAQATRQTQLHQAQTRATSPNAKHEAQWQFTTDWSLPPEDCIEFLLPGARGYTSYAFDPKPYTGRMGSAHQVLRQHSICFGVCSLLLICIAVASRKLSPDIRPIRWFWLSMAILTLLLAFGRYTPIYRIIWQLPLINQIRAPVKWLHLTGFAVAILAGIGAETLIKRYSKSLSIVICMAIAISGIFIIRPYVFPIVLPTVKTFKELPAQSSIFASPNYHAFIRAMGHCPTTNPYQATAALLLEPRVHGFELRLRTK